MRYALATLGIASVAVGLLVAGALGALAATGYDEVAPFNKFAVAYNAYTGLLKDGVDDRKAQKRMLDGWRDLCKSQHWPAEYCR